MCDICPTDKESTDTQLKSNTSFEFKGVSGTQAAVAQSNFQETFEIEAD
jgi:hypothetical protein